MATNDYRVPRFFCFQTSSYASTSMGGGSSRATQASRRVSSESTSNFAHGNERGSRDGRRDELRRRADRSMDHRGPGDVRRPPAANDDASKDARMVDAIEGGGNRTKLYDNDDDYDDDYEDDERRTTTTMTTTTIVLPGGTPLLFVTRRRGEGI